MIWPGDTRPLYERALLAREFERGRRRHKRVKDSKDSHEVNPWRYLPVVVTRIGLGFYVRLPCGHTVRRRSQPSGDVACAECWDRARELERN